MDNVLYVSVNLTSTPSTRCLAVSLQVANKYSFCRILDDAVNSNPHPVNATFRGLVASYPSIINPMYVSSLRILNEAVNSNPHPLNATFRGFVEP